MIHIYTDGANKGNGQKNSIGSYAFVVVEEGKVVFQYARRVDNTTNNVMELRGAIDALSWAHEQNCFPITIHTDSKYVYLGITEWVAGWKRKDWRKGDKSPVLNRELWEELDSLNTPEITWKHVYGHRDNEFNNLADKLCNGILKHNNS